MSDSTPPPSAPAPAPRPTVVGIGASAGGLQALKRFFAAVPADSGLAYVVVVHLAPEGESHLADLLQPHAPVPVMQVTDTVPLEPDQVYVIPPGRNLSAVDSHLRLSRPEGERRVRTPIDHFLRTLAASHDGHSVAVILSGTGSDGALGVREVREQGGITVVQDPDEAEFDGMPRSALGTGCVDLVVPVEQMPRRILDFARTRPHVSAEAAGGAPAEEPDRVPRILTQVQARTGQDFSRYKRSTVERRIQRRMQLQGIEALPAYLELLRESPQEAAALAEDLLINVTSFFRDRAVFEYLEREVVPRLFEGKGSADRVRVWSVGCATGEEAYSLAMLLLEEAARREERPQIQVFASDLHERSLHFARDGFYPPNIEADVSPERLGRFFQQENGGYRVRKELRELVVFAPHNLLRDAPFSHLDLVSCRNVLIYLQRDVQEEVVELFHYALHGEGCLLVGTAETLDHSELFRAESKEHHLYRRRNTARAGLRLPRLPLSPPVQGLALAAAPRGGAVRPDPAAATGAVHARMVEQYAPPSLLVGGEHGVLHVSERAGRYLHVSGVPSSNVFQLVREELRVELRTALHLARERQTVSRSRPVPVRIDGETRSVVLRVSPTGLGEAEGLFLVIFDEVGETAGVEEAAPAEHEATVRELEAELQAIRDRLQSLVEEYEAGQEEMRAANEELQSANEELRSTMEELETSKEELQSINEELQTLNQENRHKVEELSQLSSDLQNLLTSTDIATLFLDRDLRILRFTPKVSALFNVRGVDRGRPLSDLTHRLGYGELAGDAREVLRTLVPVERVVTDERGRWYLTRVLPYRSGEDRIEGVVITFVDITERRRAEAALRVSEARFRALVTASSYAVYRMSPDWSEMRQLDGRGFVADTTAPSGDWLGEYIHPDDQAQVTAAIREAIRTRGLFELEHRIRRVDGTLGWALSRAVPLLDQNGDIVEWFGAASDVSARMEAETALRESEAKYRTLFGSMDEAYAVVEVLADAEGRWSDFRFLEVNPAFLRHTGMEDPVGRTAVEILGTPNPRWAELYGRVAETGVPVRVEEPELTLGRVFDLNIFRVGGEGSRRVAVLFTDITQRARTEAALRESEERLRLAVDATGLGISDWDLGTDRVMVNAGFREIFGVPGGDEVLGATLLGEVVHPEDRARVGEGIAGAMDPGGSGRFEVEHRVLTPAGQRWVLTSGQIYFTGEGSGRRAARMIGNHLDVTERRRADAERRAGAERQAFLLELSDALRAETEADAIATRALSVLARRLRLDRCYVGVYRLAEDRGELSPQVGTERVPPVPAVVRLSDFPEALRVASDGTLVFEDVMAMEGVSDEDRRNLGALGIRGLVVATLRRGQGNPFWSIVAVSADPRRWEPGEIALVEEVAERTWGAVERARAEAALRESEERLRLFSEAASEVIWMRDAETLRWEYLSPAFTSIYGRERGPLLGTDPEHGWAALIVPEDRDEALAAMRRVQAGERLTFEYRIRRPDGQVRWIRNTDFPIPAADGAIRRIGGIGQDVTDRKRAEAMLQEWNETLERRVAERTAELATAVEARRQVLQQLITTEEEERRRISRELHDQLGQQITGLILGLRGVQKDTHGTAAAERLRELERLAAAIARDMQNMAVELRPPALDTLGLVAAVQNHLEEWSRRHEVECDFHARGLEGVRLPPETEATLYRVAQEGLTNVLKHAGATRVSLLLERTDGTVRLILEDDGAGFEVDETLRSPEKARRLGVRGMRERIALLAGEMEIESAPGSGTTLYVRIPESLTFGDAVAGEEGA